MRAFFFALCVSFTATACTGVTETNVAPAPCQRDDECGPDQICVPLDDYDAGATDAAVPAFCRDRET